MSGLRGTLGRMLAGAAVEIVDAPPAELTVAPDSPQQIARLLDFASEHGLTVLPWGGGTHQGIGGRVEPDVVLSTSRMTQIIEWNPDDLTVVAASGATLGDLDGAIESRHQSAVLPEGTPSSTVGGVVAAGISGWRRMRYGPTRDRMLQVVFVTGDGRVVTGGARVVKNVTGYDLPRLLTGSFGALGVITSVCLKLWPDPEMRATVVTADPQRSLAVAYRPQAVLETRGRVAVYLGGTHAEVEAQAEALGGEMSEGFDWPAAIEAECVVRLRMPPSETAAAVTVLGDRPLIAAHGVGEVVAACDPDEVEQLRDWAAPRRGSVVIEHAPQEVYESVDPWGEPPPSAGLQRRIKAAFDPVGVLVPGRLPGGI